MIARLWIRAASECYFFFFSRVFSNVRSVLSQCYTQLRLLHLQYAIEVMWRKTIEYAFSTRFLSNRAIFLWVYWRNKPRGILGEHEESL